MFNYHDKYKGYLKDIQSAIDPRVFPSLRHSTFESFVRIIANSSGYQEECSYQSLCETLENLDSVNLFCVFLRGNSMAADLAIQSLYASLSKGTAAQLQYYQVENIYFASCPVDYTNITTIAEYLTAVAKTQWHDPMDKLCHCYINWHYDDAKADLLVINKIKDNVVSYLHEDARRFNKKVDLGNFSRTLFLTVLKEKKVWSTERRMALVATYHSLHLDQKTPHTL